MPGRKMTRENASNGGKKKAGATAPRTLEIRREIRNLLAKCASRHEIYDEIGERYHIGHGAVDKHITVVWNIVLDEEKEAAIEKRKRATFRLRKLIRKTHQAGRYTAIVAAEKLLAEVEGTLQPRKLELAGPGGQPLLDPGFQKLLDLVLRALDAFPEARQAVEDAVRRATPQPRPEE